MLQPGTVQKVVLDRQTDFGFFIDNEDNDILLHNNEIVGDVEEGDEVEIFIYTDKQNRLAATMTIPKVQKGRYDWVEVVGVEYRLGVFVNIGIQKDILVSEDDLPVFNSVWPEEGDVLYVTLGEDQMGRLLAKPATEPIIEAISVPAPDHMHNKNIVGRVYRVRKVGTFLITNEGYRCFIHESERDEEPRLGQLVEARVVGVKEDGSLNVSLLPRKQESIMDDADIIYDYMASRGGAMPYWDRSAPDDIQARFQMSKSAFKRAIGKLMKEKKVYQEDGWTYFSKE